MKFLKTSVCALALATASAFAAPALANGVNTASGGDGASLHAGALEVPVNKSQVVTTDRAIGRAMIGNAEIADVLPISDRSVYVLGKQFGTTSLTLYDRTNRVIAVMDVSVGPDVDGLRKQLAEHLPGNAIDAQLSNGSVVLTGMVNDAGAASRAAQLAKAFAGDKVVNMMTQGSSQQVMLEVRFAEVSRRWGDEVGVQASAQSKNGKFGGVFGNGSTFTPGASQTQTIGTSSNTNNSSNSTTTTNTSSVGSVIGQGDPRGIAGTGASAAVTPSYTGSVGDFTNLGNLAGKEFSGAGYAGSTGVAEAGSKILGTVGGAIASSVATTTNTLSGILQMGPVSNGFGIFRQQFSIGNLAIDAVLNALETRGLAKTLAEPTLIALSGEKASFLAGGEFPIPVAQTGQSTGGGGQAAISVEFKSFGVSLGFTPTVLADKVISMVVEPEVSSLDPSASVAINGLVIPGLRTRRASTTVELRDGESFAIAGLLSKDFQTTVRQLPLLGSLPIIGSLFRSSNFQKGETELLIVVTPRLVSPIKPEQVRLPTDRIKDPRPVDVLIDGEGYHPQALEPQAGDASQKKGETAGAADAAPAKKEQGYEF